MLLSPFSAVFYDRGRLPEAGISISSNLTDELQGGDYERLYANIRKTEQGTVNPSAGRIAAERNELQNWN